MWELLRDPVWQGIGAAISVLAIISSIVLGMAVYRLQRRRKELGYRVLSETRVAAVEAAVGERVQILYEGQPVSDVHLVIVELVNSGNQPILRGDYQYPLHVGLGEGTQVLTVEQVDSNPEGINPLPSITQSRNEVRVEPVLLNAGDSFRLKLLVTKYGGTVDLEARIVGVKQIKLVGPEPRKLRLAVAYTTLALTACVYLGAALVGITALVKGSWATILVCFVVMAVDMGIWVRWGGPLVDRLLRP
jgi:hypothetical protein